MLRLEVLPDADAAGAYAADVVAETMERAIAERDRFAWAISGGSTPEPMFRRLGGLDVPWERVATWQVDERIAPDGDPARNRTRQAPALPPAALEGVRWMPVEDEDLEGAAQRYAATLPERFDLVHLGLGVDGHTASLVPDDDVVRVRDRDVAVTGPYEGTRRMTLTYPGLARAARALWLVTGDGKRRALERLLARDGSIPASGVSIADQVVVADRAARPGPAAEGS